MSVGRWRRRHDITLERVSITPSFTRATVCYISAPSLNSDSVDIELQIGTEVIDLSGSAASNIGFRIGSGLVTLLPAAAELPPNCSEILINQSLYEMDGEWVLTIGGLSRRIGGIGMIYADDTTTIEYFSIGVDAPADFVPTLEARLEALVPGIPIEPLPSGEFQRTGVRVTLPTEQAEQLAAELDNVIVEQLEGPWVFRFTPS